VCKIFLLLLNHNHEGELKMIKILNTLKLFFLGVAEAAHGMLFRYMGRQGLILHAVQLPNGALIAIAASYGVAKTMSVITNADPAVATLEASHGILEDDIMEVTSGWSRLNDRVIKAGTVATNDVDMAGLDSQSTTLYPAGSGIGSIREILTWTSLTQVLTAESSGGEQRFLQYQLLEADSEIQIPTVKGASQIVITVADDETLAGYILALVANDDGLPRAVRITLPNGSVIYYNAYISASRIPSLSVNNVMSQEITMSLLGTPFRY